MDPDKLIVSADAEIQELQSQKWRQTLRLLQTPAGAALRECYASCSKALIPFLSPTVATRPASEEKPLPHISSEGAIAEAAHPSSSSSTSSSIVINRSLSHADPSRASQISQKHRRSHSADESVHHAEKNTAEQDLHRNGKVDITIEEHQDPHGHANTALQDQTGVVQDDTNSKTDAKTDAMQAWEMGNRQGALEALKADDVPHALERLYYAEKRCPESRMKALRKIKRLIAALNLHSLADTVDSKGSDARRQTDEAFQGAISAMDDWNDYISAFWFLQAALKSCPTSAQAAQSKIMAKLDMCNQKLSEEA